MGQCLEMLLGPKCKCNSLLFSNVAYCHIPFNSVSFTVFLATKQGGFDPGVVQFGARLTRGSLTVTMYSTSPGVHGQVTWISIPPLGPSVAVTLKSSTGRTTTVGMGREGRKRRIESGSWGAVAKTQHIDWHWGLVGSTWVHTQIFTGKRGKTATNYGFKCVARRRVSGPQH